MFRVSAGYAIWAFVMNAYCSMAFDATEQGSFSGQRVLRRNSAPPLSSPDVTLIFVCFCHVLCNLFKNASALSPLALFTNPVVGPGG